MRKRILVVDDSAPLREMFRQVLSAHGFEVLAAANAPDAWAALERQPVDVVLSDVELPGTSGLELCRALQRRAEAGHPRLPVWLMTGLDGPGLGEEALAAGAMAILQKPFRIPDACARISSHLVSIGEQSNRVPAVSASPFQDYAEPLATA